MKKSEFEAIPVTDKVMLGSHVVWDDEGSKWWIGEIDGKPHRRRFGPQFSTAEFSVSHKDRTERVLIPFTGEPDERLVSAAKSWGEKQFGCGADELSVTASS